MKKIIEIEEFGIGIALDSGDFSSYGAWATGEIWSTMHKPPINDLVTAKNMYEEIGTYYHHNATVDAIEAMVLAHAISGLDVTQERYKEGIRAALEAAEKELVS